MENRKNVSRLSIQSKTFTFSRFGRNNYKKRDTPCILIGAHCKVVHCQMTMTLIAFYWTKTIQNKTHHVSHLHLKKKPSRRGRLCLRWKGLIKGLFIMARPIYPWLLLHRYSHSHPTSRLQWSYEWTFEGWKYPAKSVVGIDIHIQLKGPKVI